LAPINVKYTLEKSCENFRIKARRKFQGAKKKGQEDGTVSSVVNFSQDIIIIISRHMPPPLFLPGFQRGRERLSVAHQIACRLQEIK